MIAASISLAFALYMSGVVLIRSAASIGEGKKFNVSVESIIASLAWGAFYYLTHAA